MPLHVPDAAHGLDLGLEGAELVVVSVVTALEQVLVAPVSGVLVSDPPGEKGKELPLSVLKCLPNVHKLLTQFIVSGGHTTILLSLS